MWVVWKMEKVPTDLQHLHPKETSRNNSGEFPKMDKILITYSSLANPKQEK